MLVKPIKLNGLNSRFISIHTHYKLFVIILILFFISKSSGIIGVYDRSIGDPLHAESDFNRFKKVSFSFFFLLSFKKESNG